MRVFTKFKQVLTCYHICFSSCFKWNVGLRKVMAQHSRATTSSTKPERPVWPPPVPSAAAPSGKPLPAVGRSLHMEAPRTVGAVCILPRDDIRHDGSLVSQRWQIGVFVAFRDTWLSLLHQWTELLNSLQSQTAPPSPAKNYLFPKVSGVEVKKTQANLPSPSFLHSWTE